MSSLFPARSETASGPQPVDSLRGHLESERGRILSEIQHYPTPIPHCDQQFNWLLEERDRITGELYALEALREQATAGLPWLAVRRRLEAERRHVLTEIQHYPTPITHCDQQFNWLIERRDEITAELYRLDALHEKAAADLEAFARSSRYVCASTTA